MPVVPEDYLNADSTDARVRRDVDGIGLSGLSTTPGLGSNANSGFGPKNPIGPIEGYPEDGKHAWRAANDDDIVDAVRNYNSTNGYNPHDARYVTPKLLKAMMMRESGGTPEAFRTDPFQVNVHADWKNTGADKVRILGLSEGQAMTPRTSVEGALKWLQYRGTIHDARGKPVRYLGHYDALKRYNASERIIKGVPAKVDYANTVMHNGGASDADWQR